MKAKSIKKHSTDKISIIPDKSLPKINLIPQDIDMVLLNLINDVFYAASLPSKQAYEDPNYKHKPIVGFNKHNAFNQPIP